MGLADLLPASTLAASNPVGSVFSIAPTSKNQANALQNALPGDLTVNTNVWLSPAYGAIIPPAAPSATSADFYRNGGTDAAGDTYAARTVGDPAVETIASIRLLGKNPLTAKTTTDLIPAFTKFFLENVQETNVERSQVVQTFGDFYVFFFGEQPPIYTFSGVLLNTDDINWNEDFMFYYDNFLRGTKCVELSAQLLVTYSNTQIEGFLMNVSRNTTAVLEKGVSVSFQVLVIDRKIMKLSVDFGLTLLNGVFTPSTSFLDLLKNGLSQPAASGASQTAQSVVNGTSPPSLGVNTSLGQLTNLSNAYPSLNLGPSASGAIKQVGS